MTDLKDLKIALLKAQLERASQYDPEWGADEDRPLARIAQVERRLRYGAQPSDWIVEGITGRIEASNQTLSGLIYGTQYFRPGQMIVLPLSDPTSVPK